MLKYFLLISLLASTSFAQSAGDAPYEISVEGAAFLPSRIYKVREILKGVGVRGSLPTGKGKFEIDTFFANAEGTNYRSLSLDYRADVGPEDFPAFVVVGLHGDLWTPPAPYDSELYAGGWHFGGGFLQPIAGGWSVREDFRYRLGPGQSLIVGLGLNYRFSN